MQSLINRLIPEIISFVTPPIDQTVVDGAAANGETLHAVRTTLLTKIVTNAASRAASVFRTPVDVRRHDIDGTTPPDGNTVIRSKRMTSHVCIGGSTTVTPTRTGS